jgi:integrase
VRWRGSEPSLPNLYLVCPDNNYDYHRDWWLAVLDEAEIEDFHWHDLRHTFASRLVMSGVDIFTVCRLMRHKNIQVTMFTRTSRTSTLRLRSENSLKVSHQVIQRSKRLRCNESISSNAIDLVGGPLGFEPRTNGL